MRLAPSSYKKDRSGVREMMERSWARDDVVHLEIGESGLDTAPHILKAATDAGKRGIRNAVAFPAPPLLLTATAGWLRNTSNSELKPRCCISAPVITETEVPTWRSGISTLDEVTMISSSLLLAWAKGVIAQATASAERE